MNKQTLVYQKAVHTELPLNQYYKFTSKHKKQTQHRGWQSSEQGEGPKLTDFCFCLAAVKRERTKREVKNRRAC